MARESGNMSASGRRLSPTVRWTLALVVLVAAAAYLRFTGLNWDQTQWIHPDEGHMRAVTNAIRWPEDLSLYFDTHRSPLNPRNNGQIYSYGTLPLFVTRAAAEWLDRACGPTPAPLSAWVAQRLIELPEGTCRAETFTWTYNAFVGRHLAALADLGTVILIGLIGWRLYDKRVGFLAMALAAFTPFLIQQAHFYTVDTTAAFFVLLTAYFSVRAGQAPADGAPPWSALALAGVAIGLATASKVSSALAAGFVALAGGWWALRRMVRSADLSKGLRPWLSAVLDIVPALVLAAVLSLVAFRVAQPYAFEGPGFFGIRRSPEWFGRLAGIQEEQSGAVDYPSGRQWANRIPVLFPWINIVVWGLGLPLGLAACAGWALMGYELLRGKLVHLLPWVWATLLFTFYATRWVKAMRYFLPLYPLLALMAAYLLITWVTRQTWRASSMRLLGGAVTALVVVGTVLWSGAVFGIYLRPHTRVAASRWIYQHVPAGAVVANEHWDWGLPLRIEGRNPFGGVYTGIELQLYNEDTPEKRAQLVDWLDRADYIFLASNRLYSSIPRLPDRYPLTIAYYRALFAGELGFDLVADVTSYPALGPFVFPDQENPFPLIVTEDIYAPQADLLPIPLPSAEESFSVYDHPRVLIFEKTPAYSRQRALDILGRVDLSQVAAWQTPQAATPPWVLQVHDIAFYAGLLLVAAVSLAGVIVACRAAHHAAPSSTENAPASQEHPEFVL